MTRRSTEFDYCSDPAESRLRPQRGQLDLRLRAFRLRFEVVRSTWRSNRGDQTELQPADGLVREADHSQVTASRQAGNAGRGSSRRGAVAAICGVLFGVTTACASGPSPQENPDNQSYLYSVRSMLGTSDLKGNEELLIQLGHDYCDYLSSEGAISAQERIGNILDDQPLTREAVMVSAGNELCPEVDPAR